VSDGPPPVTHLPPRRVRNYWRRSACAACRSTAAP